MNLFELVRNLLDESVGTRGALRNCRTELSRRAEAEREVDRLCRRIPTVEGRSTHDARRATA